MDNHGVGLMLIDSGSTRVTWANDAIAGMVGHSSHTALVGMPLDEAFPLGGKLGLAEALSALRDSEGSISTSADLVSTGRGSVKITCTLYTLPIDGILITVERHWENTQRERRR